MKPYRTIRNAFVLLAVSAPLVTPVAARSQTTPPPGMAAVENARSVECVTRIKQVADLNAAAAPYARRAQRINALARAVALEDTSDVTPFDTLDATERGVRDWYVQDHALALKIVAGDSSLVAQRDQAREAVKKRLDDAMTAVNTEAQAKLAGADSIQAAARPCQSAIFVRPAVLEACKTTSSPLCAPARLSPDSVVKVSQFRFVNAPEDLWDVEQLRPWSAPGPLQVGSDGALTGARTSTLARHGNIIVAVALAPMIRERSQLDSSQVAEYQANLDSLGMTFDHPDFVMAPALEVQASVPPPVGDENLYLLHFGQVANPDVVWSVQDTVGGMIQATFPATAKLLDRLKAGDPLSFTAVKVPPGSTEGTPVYSITLMNAAEGQAATQLLGYMKSDLNKDLKSLAPPGSGSGS